MKFCDSVLWNSSTVYDERPDLTPCFQNSFIYWIPCFILWLISPLWFRMIRRKREIQVKITWLTYSKLVCSTNWFVNWTFKINFVFLKQLINLLLIIIEITNLVTTILNEKNYLVFYITPCLLIISYVSPFYYFRRTSLLLFIIRPPSSYPKFEQKSFLEVRKREV